MVAKREKDLSVETLRGIAIILVVIGHVIGYDSKGGMKVADDSFLRHIYDSFQYVRMPLFTAISGWVYALIPVNKTYFSQFVLKKFRRIYLPLVFVGGMYYILQSITPNTNLSYPLSDIWRILIFPYTFYWYLPALLIVFLIVGVLDINKLIDKFSVWTIIFCLSVTILIFRDDIFPSTVKNVFAFKNAIYLFPFFLLGLAIKRFKSIFNNRTLLYSSAILLITGMIFQQLVWYKVFDYKFSSIGGVGLLIGLLGVIFLLNIKLNIKYFIWIGNFAYTIFLFHSFGTSGGRIILSMFDIDNTVIVFFVSLLLGIFLPVVVEIVLDRSGIFRMLFLGRSFNRLKD
jgi:glucan biosynthesis protein C